MALPPDDAANQPLNPNPCRIGEPGLAAIEPPVVVEPFAIELPPWLLYVTFKEFGLH